MHHALALPVLPWQVRLFDRLVTLANGRVLRSVSLWIAMGLLLLRRVAPGRIIQRFVLGFVKMEAECCTAESPHFQFLQRYVSRFERAGTLERARRFLREAKLSAAARRLDAWVRIGVFGTLRHEILAKHRGKPGVPPRLLTEAQLALSPGCDLTCEGCYTAEDRGGAAPRREDIAFLVDEAASCGAFIIHVVGKGEPFLSPTWANELLDVIASRPNLFFTVATHGMHIDEALAERMSRIGNLLVFVSVDGPQPLHDARRGAGSHRRVHETFERLRRHGVLFGFSSMVSAKSHAAVTSREYVRDLAEAGCAIGIYSRYFPLASTSVDALALDAERLALYQRSFAAVEKAAYLPLLDLDEVEQHTGCHSRAGESVYIDGITGLVAPCLRVPFAPDECRVDREGGGRLAAALSHAFFVAYRKRSGSCPSWCGANLEGELAAVGGLFESARVDERLGAYRARSSVRRLPLVSTEVRP